MRSKDDDTGEASASSKWEVAAALALESQRLNEVIQAQMPDPVAYTRARIAIAVAILKTTCRQGTEPPESISDAIRMLEDVLAEKDGPLSDSNGATTER